VYGASKNFPAEEGIGEPVARLARKSEQFPFGCTAWHLGRGRCSFELGEAALRAWITQTFP
jgi:hypothetical protein